MIKYIKGKCIKSYRSYFRWYMKKGRWGTYIYKGINEAGYHVLTRLN